MSIELYSGMLLYKLLKSQIPLARVTLLPLRARLSVIRDRGAPRLGGESSKKATGLLIRVHVRRTIK